MHVIPNPVTNKKFQKELFGMILVLLPFENKTENFPQPSIYNLFTTLSKGKHRSIYQIYPIDIDISCFHGNWVYNIGAVYLVA